DEAEVRATLARSLLLGAGLGLAVMALQWPLAMAWFAVVDASAAVEGQGLAYFQARIWGAPAALALYAFSGALIGLGHSRALLLAGGLGWALMALQWPRGMAWFAVMDASAAVEGQGLAYFQARIWGAPAALALYAFSGALIGLGHSRALLLVQLLLNGLNAGLDVYFAGVLGMGARGIGLGTSIAEWSTCAVAALVLWRTLRA